MQFLYLLISLMMPFGGSGSGYRFVKKECSVFPIKTKDYCFPSTFDIAYPNQPQKEIKFDAVNTHGTIQTTTDTVPNEGTIEVDVEDLVAEGNDEDTYYCDKEPLFGPDLENPYKDDTYGTKFKYSIASEDPNSLFITTRREIWTCSLSEDGENPFKRVVTEHLSKQPIRDIHFHDGTDVMKIPIPKRNGEKQLFTTAIREIKYVKSDKPDEKLHYRGSFIFKELKADKHYYQDFERLSGIEVGEFKQFSIERKQRPQKRFFKQQPLNNERIPSPILDQNAEAICSSLDNELKSDDPEEIKGMIEQGLYGVFPRWSDGNSFDSASTKIEFLDHFVVTKYRLWGCLLKQEENADDETRNAVKYFYRIEIHYLGTTRIDEAQFSNTRELTVYSFKLPYTTDKSMGIIETIHFHGKPVGSNEWNFFNYRGKVKVIQND